MNYSRPRDQRAVVEPLLYVEPVTPVTTRSLATNHFTGLPSPPQPRTPADLRALFCLGIYYVVEDQQRSQVSSNN